MDLNPLSHEREVLINLVVSEKQTSVFFELIKNSATEDTVSSGAAEDTVSSVAEFFMSSKNTDVYFQ